MSGRLRLMRALNARQRLISKPRPSSRSDMMTYIERRLTNPNFMIPFILSLVLIYTYSTDAAAKSTNNILNTYIIKIIANPSTKTFGEWLKVNVPFMFGMLAFVPTYLAAPRSKRNMVIGLLALYFFIIPMKSPYEYLVEGLLLYLFIGTSNTSLRMGCVILALLLYFVQYQKFLPTFTSYDYTKATPTDENADGKADE